MPRQSRRAARGVPAESLAASFKQRYNVLAVLNVPRLRILYELSRRGSVSAAAEALWITPSAVSQQLSALEREVGAELVERVGRGVRPTEAGRRLALEAERVLAALDFAQSTAHELRSADHAALRVAAFPSVVLGVLSPALAQLRSTHPDLVVDVFEVEGAAGLDRVRLGRADVAVVDDWGWHVGTEHPGLQITPLMSDPLLALLPARHPLGAAESVRWADLAGSDWVVEPGNTLFAQQISAHCRRAGFEPRVRARVRDFATQAALVNALGLVTVLPRTALSSTDGVVARPLRPDVRRRLMIVARQGFAEHGYAGLLMTALVQYSCTSNYLGEDTS
jgi:DNA-binding transcriptional LysR family regulator